MCSECGSKGVDLSKYISENKPNAYIKELLEKNSNNNMYSVLVARNNYQAPLINSYFSAPISNIIPFKGNSLDFLLSHYSASKPIDFF